MSSSVSVKYTSKCLADSVILQIKCYFTVQWQITSSHISPETLEHAEPVPWRARAKKRTPKFCPNAKTENGEIRMFALTTVHRLLIVYYKRQNEHLASHLPSDDSVFLFGIIINVIGRLCTLMQKKCDCPSSFAPLAKFLTWLSLKVVSDWIRLEPFRD